MLRTISCPATWTSLEDIPPAPNFESIWMNSDERRLDNELSSFIQWESEMLDVSEFSAFQHNEWLKFATQCDAEYQAERAKLKTTDGRRSDKNLTCRECAGEFVFTVYEQEKFKKRNWIEPKTCIDCIRLR